MVLAHIHKRCLGCSANGKRASSSFDPRITSLHFSAIAAISNRFSNMSVLPLNTLMAEFMHAADQYSASVPPILQRPANKKKASEKSIRNSGRGSKEERQERLEDYLNYCRRPQKDNFRNQPHNR